MKFNKISFTTFMLLSSSLCCMEAAAIRTEAEITEKKRETSTWSTFTSAEEAEKLDALFAFNLEKLGIVPHLYARVMLQAEYHDEMIAILSREDISALDRLAIYAEKDGQENMINVTRNDIKNLKETAAFRNLASMLKSQIFMIPNPADLFFQQYFSGPLSDRDKDSIITSHRSVTEVKELLALLNASPYKNFAEGVFEEFAKMSVVYFLQIEKMTLKIFQGLIHDLSNTLEQTVEDNARIIGPFVTLYSICTKQEKYNFGQKAEMRPQELLKHARVLNRGFLQGLISSTELQGELPEFFTHFLEYFDVRNKQTSMTHSTISISVDTAKEEGPLPLENEAVERRIKKNYSAAFRKALIKRNSTFKRKVADVFEDYSLATKAILDLYDAQIAFEEEKEELRLTGNRMILESKQSRERAATTKDSSLRKPSDVSSVPLAQLTMKDPVTDVIPEMPKAQEASSVSISSSSVSVEETKQELPFRKQKRWHTAGAQEDTKHTAVPISSAVEYLYGENPTDWPLWIQDLKQISLVNMEDMYNGFAKDLGGTVIQENNKIILMFRSPVTGKIHIKGGHALHHGSDEKRFPAIRKAFMELLTEACIIPR